MRKHYNVAIIGGGAAGIAAAVGAAQFTDKVALFDENLTLGGMATRAFVGTICGISRTAKNRDAPPKLDLQGFSKEFVESLSKIANTNIEVTRDGLVYLPYSQRAFYYATLETLKRCENLTIKTQTRITSAELDRVGRYFSIATVSGNQSAAFEADRVVDCTGHSVLAKLAGLDYLRMQSPQVGALVFRIHNLPKIDSAYIASELKREVLSLCDKLGLEQEKYETSLVPGSLREDSGFFKLSLPDIRTPESAGCESFKRAARSRLQVIQEILSKHSVTFREIEIDYSAPDIGIRSGDRGLGSSLLDDNRIFSKDDPPDGIAYGFWPFENWGNPRFPKMKQLGARGFYTIPFGSLRSSHCEQLYFAGKCISASEEAITSARVIGTCLQTGWAAGVAAALSSKLVSDEDIIRAIRDSQLRELAIDE